MEYKIFKLKFLTSVHFGTGGLTRVQGTLHADTVFSALCIEADKMGCMKELLDAVQNNRIRISDGLPYIGSKLYIPKPLARVEFDQTGDSRIKKAVKKLEYIPVDVLGEYLSGEMDIQKEGQEFRDGFGRKRLVEKAAVHEGKDAEPYAVGTFTFMENSGLYIIIGYEKEEEFQLLCDLMESLSYAGIGGKRTSGYGRFELMMGKMVPGLLQRLTDDGFHEYVTLSVSMPEDDELPHIMETASYRLIKRSGFVYSTSYDDRYRKKKDAYLMDAGSVFRDRFSGRIIDVSNHGSHPVYRYAKPVMLGVR